MVSIWSIELLDIAIIGNESIHRNKMCANEIRSNG